MVCTILTGVERVLAVLASVSGIIALVYAVDAGDASNASPAPAPPDAAPIIAPSPSPAPVVGSPTLPPIAPRPVEPEEYDGGVGILAQFLFGVGIVLLVAPFAYCCWKVRRNERTSLSWLQPASVV